MTKQESQEKNQEKESQEKESQDLKKVKIYYWTKLTASKLSYLKDNHISHHQTKKDKHTFEVKNDLVNLNLTGMKNWIKDKSKISLKSFIAKIDFLRSDNDLDDEFIQEWLNKLTTHLKKAGLDRLGDLSPNEMKSIKKRLSKKDGKEFKESWFDAV